jgi:cyclopropane-fatty-acyl-phospholipid synthase
MWLVAKFLDRLVDEGPLTVVGHDGGRRSFGSASPHVKPVTIRFHDARVQRDILRNPRLAVGEAYMDGRLTVEEGDVLDFLRLVTWNGRWERGGDRRRLFKRPGSRWMARLGMRNRVGRAKANVAHHYDLSDRLYDLFLDADRQYSCAYFTDPANTLTQAQDDKKAHIAAKLHLKPGQRVLDIGCGWGGMALYLHAKAGVDVLGVTLSEEQLAVARRRAAEAGVSDHVRFELIDYRHVSGTFDRIVSVGMFEHVGPSNYETFFAKCKSLLVGDGVMLLHTIGKLGKPGSTDPWLNKYIFPGGYNPALSEIVAASEKSKLIAADVEMLRLHYGYTIAHWLRACRERRAEIVALYDERFWRMWEFYLAGAITTFENGSGCNYQVQYIRERRTLPILRDYMAGAEAAFRG